MNKMYPSITVKKYIKGLRFYPVNKLVSWSVTVSWMLAENMRFLDQRKRTSLFMTKQ